jgi:bacterioferritin-associated ferredoxin
VTHDDIASRKQGTAATSAAGVGAKKMSRSQKRRAEKQANKEKQQAARRSRQEANALHRREQAVTVAELLETNTVVSRTEQHSARQPQKQPAGASCVSVSEREMHEAATAGAASVQQLAMLNQEMLKAQRGKGRMKMRNLDPVAAAAMKVDERIPAFHEEFAASGR